MNQFNLVVHMTECKPNSTIASAKVAKFIVETLVESRFNLVDTKAKAHSSVITGCEVDNLIIVNGPMAFCDFLPELAELVRLAKRVFWVQQDYTINPPSRKSEAESPFRKVFAEKDLRPHFWTTVSSNVQTIWDQYINWNKLTYDPQPLPLLSDERILFYYGAFREKRVEDFKKWFDCTAYQTVISTTPIRGKKFSALCNGVKIVPPFNDLGHLPLCRATLYIEDAPSHKSFHSPANRFYEMISAGIPMFFANNTLNTLENAGLTPATAWIVSNKEELVARLNDSKFVCQMQLEQRIRWHYDYKAQLKQELLNIWSSY